MSIMSNDFGGQMVVQIMCDKIGEKITEFPQAAQALKEVGIEMLDLINGNPGWTNSYYERFRTSHK